MPLRVIGLELAQHTRAFSERQIALLENAFDHQSTALRLAAQAGCGHVTERKCGLCCNVET